MVTEVIGFLKHIIYINKILSCGKKVYRGINLMLNNKRRGLVLVISSPSGAGKTTICKKIIEED